MLLPPSLPPASNWLITLGLFPWIKSREGCDYISSLPNCSWDCYCLWKPLCPSGIGIVGNNWVNSLWCDEDSLSLFYTGLHICKNVSGLFSAVLLGSLERTKNPQFPFFIFPPFWVAIAVLPKILMSTYWAEIHHSAVFSLSFSLSWTDSRYILYLFII